MSVVKETPRSDVDRLDTLLLIGSSLKEVFKAEDGGATFNVSSPGQRFFQSFLIIYSFRK